MTEYGAGLDPRQERIVIVGSSIEDAQRCAEALNLRPRAPSWKTGPALVSLQTQHFLRGLSADRVLITSRADEILRRSWPPERARWVLNNIDAVLAASQGQRFFL